MLHLNNQFLKENYESAEERMEEITSYINLVVQLDKGRNNSILQEVDGKKEIFEIDRETHKTLRAATYLLVYNLIESALSNAVDAIHKTLATNNLKIKDLSNPIKKIIYKNIKNGLSEANIKDFIDINFDVESSLVSIGHEKSKIYSGNIDYREIRETSVRYGFDLFKKNPIQDTDLFKMHTEEFSSVKKHRNELAHGAVSFKDCGQNITAEVGVQKIFEAAKIVINMVYEEIDDFLTSEKHKCPGPSSGQ